MRGAVAALSRCSSSVCGFCLFCCERSAAACNGPTLRLS
jgi:hypothetical protein